jgi:hypothetical protein
MLNTTRTRKLKLRGRLAVEYILHSEQFFGQTRSSEMSAYACRNNFVQFAISLTVSLKHNFEIFFRSNKYLASYDCNVLRNTCM